MNDATSAAIKGPKTGARTWRFVHDAMKRAADSVLTSSAKVHYTKASNYDKRAPADIAQIIVDNGWGEIAEPGYYPTIRINDAGRAALPAVQERAVR